MKGDERGLHGWRWMKADVNGWKWIKWMKVDENIRRATCMHDSLMPLLMILISMTMMKFTVSFHKSWVVSFPCGKLCPNQRWPSCRSPECCFAHNSKSFLSSFSLSLSPLSWSPPESQWLTLQVLLCCRCLGFAPHPRIVDDPCSNVSAIGTVTVCVILILIVETSEGCCTGSKRRWRLVQGGRGGSTKKLFAFLWKIWKLLRRENGITKPMLGIYSTNNKNVAEQWNFRNVLTLSCNP